jgi:hypothetical protein
MIEISHLVVDGCSLSYCQGLENPHIDGWPALLAKKIGVPVVNIALPGSSNDGIHRRVYNYVYKSIDFYNRNNIESKPFYITALTFAGRREEYFENYYGWQDTKRYYTLDLSPNMDKVFDIIDNKKTDPQSIAAYLEYGYMLNFNLQVALLDKLQYWASLINLFRQNNLNYGIGDYIPTYEEDVLDTMKIRYKPLYDFIYNDKGNFGDFASITRKLDKLPCGHDGFISQQAQANNIYSKIISTYGEIKAVPISKIYKLKQYYFTEPFSNLALISPWYINV